MPVTGLVALSVLLAACAAPGAGPTATPVPNGTPAVATASTGMTVPGADAMIATVTAGVAASQTAAARLITPTLTPTPVPLRTALTLPAPHPMATVWVFNGAPVAFERAARLAVDGDGNFYVVEGSRVPAPASSRFRSITAGPPPSPPTRGASSILPTPPTASRSSTVRVAG
jgi:hypothetical protein